MDKTEIYQSYKSAANKAKQIAILAELNDCTIDDVILAIAERLKPCESVADSPKQPPKNNSLTNILECELDRLNGEIRALEEKYKKVVDALEVIGEIGYDREFLLQDRLQKIRQIIDKYGEENFCQSFSGGKDSTVLSALVDMAIPDNKIPRVYANTGIELNMIRNFVLEMQKTDDRVVVIKPSVPIKKTLEKDGYPFKSKYHSKILATYQRSGMEGMESVTNYLQITIPKSGIIKHNEHLCPKILKYQFTPEYSLKISAKCCDRLKKEPLNKWQAQNNKPYPIIGIMPSEGGQRESAQCLAFKGDKLKAFQPLVPVTKEWEDWFIEEYNIKICDIYKEPYNFPRTGCKGCPFNITLQKELDTLDKYFPAERKQCEYIWKPVYDEYRRIGYRLRPLEDGRQMDIFEFMEEQHEHTR